MSILECRSLGKDVSGRLLFSNIAFSIQEGEKLGIIGPNGCGKTSLVRILSGEDDDFAGTLTREPGRRIGYVPQAPSIQDGMTALDFLLAGVNAERARLSELEEEMGRNHGTAVMDRYAERREAYDAMGGDEAEDRARRSLERTGLGEIGAVEANSLSGGERNVLSLLKAMQSSPDLLILDEPGNHLDIWGRAWLEGFLADIPAAVLVVSHDRWLLDRVCGGILSFENGGISRYAGNYSAARLERLKRDAAQGAGWQADRKRVERLEGLVERFEVIARNSFDPAWGKRLRARRSQLERERERARDKPEGDGRTMAVDFAAASFKSTYALKVEDYRKAYGDAVLIERSGFDLLGGEKSALVGPNGCGKTSFIRDVVDAAGDPVRSDDRGIRVSPSAVIGYIEQGREGFNPGRTVMEAIEDLGARPDEARNLLRRFLFERADLEKRVDVLSGGEYKRLQIAKAIFLKADFLILDEPTNHLDIPSREAVEEALIEFDGTILLVSHDRYLLEAVAERIVEIRDRAFKAFEGHFSEYWAARGGAAMAAPRARHGMEGRAKSLDKAKEGRDEGDATIAARIESMEAEKAGFEKSAREAISTKDFARARTLAAKAEKIGRLIEDLYERYCGGGSPRR